MLQHTTLELDQKGQAEAPLGPGFIFWEGRVASLL